MDKRRGKLGKKLSALILLCMTALTALLACFSYRSMRGSYIAFYSQKARNTARMLANLVDGDKIESYIETGVKDAYYEELERLFGKMKEDSGVAFTYIFYPREDHFLYILDGYTRDDDRASIAELGDVYWYGETEYRYLYPDVLAKKASDRIILGKDVGFGESVSAWAPVFDSEGRLTAMVEADFYLSEVNREIFSYLTRFLAILLAGIAGIVLLLLLYTRRFVSRPVELLTLMIASCRDGRFNVPGQLLHTGDEMELLTEAFVDMEAEIDRYVEDIKRIAGEKERIGAELSIATQIQADMLPSIFPAFPEREDVDIFASMRPAREVGGDFYDFFLVDDSRLAVVIADVSGKGVPAALFMVIAKTLIKNHAVISESPKKIFENVNRRLCEGNREGFFVTAWLGIIDLKTGRTDYVNAGHNPPILLKADGTIVWLRKVSGFVLAGMEDMVWTQESFTMENGDRLFLYTDGVTEAMNENEELYGEERLSKALAGLSCITVRESVKAVEQALSRYCGSARQYDDITMLEVALLKEREV